MPSKKGTAPGKDYSWIASTHKKQPDIITIRDHPIWKSDEDIVIRKLLKVLSHEPIHQILWGEELEAGDDYDIGRDLFFCMLKPEITDEELVEIGITM